MKVKDWKTRYKERTDIITKLVHLTRKTNDASLVEVLIKIIVDSKIKGSTTESGFIVGDRSAVCFQEAPLQGIVHNVYNEQRYNNKDIKRYYACGLMFDKMYVYERGGRPVIYDKTSDAKKYLDSNEYWRIVNFDLNSKNIIDWTHEREWRVPDDFSFDLSEAHILVPNTSTYRKLLELYLEQTGNEIFEDVKSVVILSEIFI